MKTCRAIGSFLWVATLGVAVGLAQTPPTKTSPKPMPQTRAGKSAGSARKPTAASDLPIVGHLERRGQIITIKAGPDGPRYSVTNKEGKVLFTDLTEKELSAKAPEVHGFLKSAVAHDPASKESTLDARVNPQVRSRAMDAGLR